MSIYLVETTNGESKSTHLVKADSKAKAREHVLKIVSTRIPTQEELVDLLLSGTQVEEA